MFTCFFFAYQVLKEDDYSVYIEDVDKSLPASPPPPRPATSHPGCRKIMPKKCIQQQHDSFSKHYHHSTICDEIVLPSSNKAISHFNNSLSNSTSTSTSLIQTLPNHYQRKHNHLAISTSSSLHSKSVCEVSKMSNHHNNSFTNNRNLNASLPSSSVNSIFSSYSGSSCNSLATETTNTSTSTLTTIIAANSSPSLIHSPTVTTSGNSNSTNCAIKQSNTLIASNPAGGHSQPSCSSTSFIFPPASGLEMTQNTSIIHQPARGWLHPDHKIAEAGISFSVRYVGCLEINTPMKSLDFETRSQVAKECINRVCEAGGLKTMDKKRRPDKRICKMLSDKPNMENAGANVNLTITSSYLNLSVMETGEVIAKHEMPNISFASGGDVDTLDFVAYVAKDEKFFRACFVLECGGGSAQDVISTIGQAFELRFKEFLKKQPHKSGSDRMDTKNSVGKDLSSHISCNQMMEGAIGGDDRDYYNDMPGKVPPDLPEKENLQKNQKLRGSINRITPQTIPRLSMKKYSSNITPDSTPNLIDLTSEIQNPIDTSQEKKTDSSIISRVSYESSPVAEHEYVNCKDEQKNGKVFDFASSGPSGNLKDPFDMQPFYSALQDASKNLGVSDTCGTNSTHTSSTNNMEPMKLFDIDNTSLASCSAKPVDHSQSLISKLWFHGPISRKESELLVIKDGDFLVRESQGSPGQYVLTGMQGGVRKHLLLVDPEGKVRTQDKTFESVTHLINYHRDNGLPIISAESVLLLRNPVAR